MPTSYFDSHHDIAPLAPKEDHLITPQEHQNPYAQDFARQGRTEFEF